jgi:hypothetical protein
LLIIVSGAALSACDPGEEGLDDGSAGSGGSGGTGGTGGSGGTGGRPVDARLPDTAASAAYQWIGIYDDQTMPACTSTGPGADVDSVDLLRGGSVIGVGLKTSASFDATQQGGPTVTPCTSCNNGACPNSGPQAAERAEGIQDGMSYASMPDTGYFSLNAGTLWVQIGQANGNSPAQEIRSGDKIIVREVDKVYIAEGSAPASCACLPEKYSVYVFTQKGAMSNGVKLKATKYWMENISMCGGSLTPGATDIGCGTTEFTVP